MATVSNAPTPRKPSIVAVWVVQEHERAEYDELRVELPDAPHIVNAAEYRDALLEPPAPEPDPGAPGSPTLPLAEWFRGQAAWYRQHPAPGSELVADAIDRLAGAVDFWKPSSVRALVAKSPALRRCDLDAAIEPADRPHSWLADALDCEAEGFLLLKGEDPGAPGPGDAVKLIAWVIRDLADDADFFHANDEVEFARAKADFEAKAIEAMFEDGGPSYASEGHSADEMPF